MSCRTLGHQLVAGHRHVVLQHLVRQRPHGLDEVLDVVGHREVGRQLVDVDRLHGDLLDAVQLAGLDRADRLGGAPLAPVAVRQRGLGQAGGGDGADQLTLEGSDAVQRRGPDPDVGRLDDDAVDLGDALKRPRTGRGPQGSSGVEHELHVLLRLDHDAVAELPVQDDRAALQPTDDVGRAEHAGHQVAEADDLLGLELQLGGRVVFVEQVQRRQQLAL